MKKDKMRNKNYGVLTVLFTVFIFITGCNLLEEGTVVDKIFISAHEENTTVYIKADDILVPVTNTSLVGDKWYIVVEGVWGDRRIRETIKVTGEEFNNIEIGQFVKIKK